MGVWVSLVLDNDNGGFKEKRSIQNPHPWLKDQAHDRSEVLAQGGVAHQASRYRAVKLELCRLSLASVACH